MWLVRHDSLNYYILTKWIRRKTLFVITDPGFMAIFWFLTSWDLAQMFKKLLVYRKKIKYKNIWKIIFFLNENYFKGFDNLDLNFRLTYALSLRSWGRISRIIKHPRFIIRVWYSYTLTYISVIISGTTCISIPHIIHL